jgi:predicted O-linked N-acetylglucosamine transferase (SPINDLY family)
MRNVGSSHVDPFSGVASSLLRTSGLPELVCGDVDAYRATVVTLAEDPARRAGLRARLQAERSGNRLFDGAAFAADIEQLYRRMWQRAAAGERPEHLPAADLQALPGSAT